MKKQLLFSTLALVLAIAVSSCKKEGFKTTEGGLEYKYIVNSDTGEVAGEGGFLELHIKLETHLDSLNKDTVLVNSYKEGGVNQIVVPAPTYSGCINNGFAMLKAGDSVVFKVLADSLYRNTFRQPPPPFLTGKEEMIITTKVLVSKSKETFEEEQKIKKEKQAKAQQKQLEKEQKELQEAAAKMGYADKLQLSPSGLFFVKLKETNGPTANKGDVASFYYKGTFLDGREFDSNYGGQPFDVRIGGGGAIAGWLEVADKIKKGEKWVIFLPSNLSYGERGQGQIPPNTPLIFEMELKDIKTAEEAQKEQEALRKRLSRDEKQKVTNYLKGKNFTKDGDKEVYYTIINEGSGIAPTQGDNIVVNLKSFDLNGIPMPRLTMEGANPIRGNYSNSSFPPAMQTVLSKLKQGGKAKVVTTSANFQGEQGGGDIPPFMPIYFELELVSVEKAKPNN